MLVDTHCHLNFPELIEQSSNLWSAAQNEGVSAMVIPSVSPDHWQAVNRLAASLDGVYWAGGLHPWWSENYFQKHSLEDLYSALSNLAFDTKCVAIGETGLDAIKGGSLEQQSAALRLHAVVAKEKSKPLIIHQYKTQAQVYLILKSLFPHITGVVHAFSGSYEQAKQWVDAGFYLGVGGVITYPRANKTRTAIKKIPLDYLVLETDAPSMPLFGEQGKINTPLQLPAIAAALAEIKAEPISLIQSITTQNAMKLFGITHASR